jgi:multidrug efflux pump subunit AcrA (membrane-fusion protein)
MEVRKETLQPRIETFGTITARTKADIYPSQEGILEDIYVEEGERIEEGQLLAVLSKEKLLLAREQAEAGVESKRSLLSLAEEKLKEGYRSIDARLLSLEKSRAEIDQRRIEFNRLCRVYEIKKQLFDAGGIPEGELETIKVQYQKSKTDLEQAERDLEIQYIGLRDQDIREAGLSMPKTSEERRKVLHLLGTRTLAAERDVAAAELSMAELELKRLEIFLKETEIRSPLQGIVGSRRIEEGEKATPETLLFSLFGIDTLYAVAEIGERDIPFLRIGQEVEVQPESYPPFPGRVQLISPYLNPQTRSAQVRILLQNSEGTLIPGLFVRIAIRTDKERQAILVPESALVADDREPNFKQQDSKQALFLVRNSVLFKVPVRLGESREEKVEIREGIREGDQVVLNPSLTFREGMPVEVVK